MKASGSPTAIGDPQKNPNPKQEIVAVSNKNPKDTVVTPPSAEKAQQHTTAAPPAVAAKSPAPNPFDPARLRVSQDLLTAAGVKKLLMTLPVRKPSKEWFVRCCPDPSYHLTTCVIELKEDSETYLVDPDLWPLLVANDPHVQPILVALPNLTDPNIGFLPVWGTIMAGCVLATLPILLVFVAFQDRFMASAIVGAVRE